MFIVLSLIRKKKNSIKNSHLYFILDYYFTF